MPGTIREAFELMQWLYTCCQWLEQTPVGIWVRDSHYGFPVIETFHLFGIVSLVGSTSVLDLRFWGVLFKDEPVSSLVNRLVPWAWAGFTVQVVTGALLFSSESHAVLWRHGLSDQNGADRLGGSERADFSHHGVQAGRHVGRGPGIPCWRETRRTLLNFAVVRNRRRRSLDLLRRLSAKARSFAPRSVGSR